jgi:hypothetical protein
MSTTTKDIAKWAIESAFSDAIKCAFGELTLSVGKGDLNAAESFKASIETVIRARSIANGVIEETLK